MNPFGWLRWLSERMRDGRRPPRRKPVLRVIEGGKQGSASPRAGTIRLPAQSTRDAIGARPAK
jgi:hypothetical protein